MATGTIYSSALDLIDDTGLHYEGHFFAKPGSDIDGFKGPGFDNFLVTNGSIAFRVMGLAPALALPRLGIDCSNTAGSSYVCFGHLLDVLKLKNRTTGRGGFTWRCRFGLVDTDVLTSARMFMGMANMQNPSTGGNLNPDGLQNVIGIGHKAGTNLMIYASGYVPQPPVDLGADFSNDFGPNNNKYYDLTFSTPPVEASGESSVYWKITKWGDTGKMAEAAGRFVATNDDVLPSPSLLLNDMWGYRANNGTAGRARINIYRMDVYAFP
jgi:hypothetical protein